MTWQQWFVIGYLVFNVVAAVALIGKPRAPLTPGDILIQMLIAASVGYMVVTL
jgi:hypothetical protein